MVRTGLCAARSARLIVVFGGGLIATLIAAGLFGSVAPATAQSGYGNMFGYQQPRYKRRAVQRSRASDQNSANATADSNDKKGKKDKKEEAKKAAPQGAVYAVISLADQHVTVYDATGRIAQSRISTGMPGHPTPIGLFSIIGKERWHHSNIYSGAPMPYMQRITWSGVAMHTGVVPGYPASHGCIRLPDSFAQQFWGMTQIGNRVVVARRDTTPIEITNALLPVPKMRPAPDALPGSQQTSLPSSSPVKLASISEHPPVAVSEATPQEPHAAPSSSAKLLNPIEYAKALKERAQASKAEAEKAAKDALAAAQAAGTEARQAVDDVKKADADLKGAEAKLAALDAQAPAAVATAGDRPLAPPATTQAVPALPGTPANAQPASATPADPAAAAAAVAAAANARAAAQADIDRARAALTEARAREAAKTPAAFAAVQAWKDAVAASDLAAETVKEADRRLEPVSILFSKKEGRVFIRQDWKEVYDAPITFKDPDRPVGTHLFIAVNGDTDGKMKWSVISVPSGAVPGDEAPRKRAKNDKSAEPAPAPAPQGDTAAAALERVEVADSVRDRIAELVWTGAQVIVTDNPRSDEMDTDTDIIVSTR
jgi:lipoprotein-anchoring transpeptidase ErfK/SrfK